WRAWHRIVAGVLPQGRPRLDGGAGLADDPVRVGPAGGDAALRPTATSAPAGAVGAYAVAPCPLTDAWWRAFDTRSTWPSCLRQTRVRTRSSRRPGSG